MYYDIIDISFVPFGSGNQDKRDKDTLLRTHTFSGLSSMLLSRCEDRRKKKWTGMH